MARLCDNCGTHGPNADIVRVDLDLPIDRPAHVGDVDLCVDCRYAAGSQDWLELHRREALITVTCDAANPE